MDGDDGAKGAAPATARARAGATRNGYSRLGGEAVDRASMLMLLALQLSQLLAEEGRMPEGRCPWDRPLPGMPWDMQPPCAGERWAEDPAAATRAGETSVTRALRAALNLDLAGDG